MSIPPSHVPHLTGAVDLAALRRPSAATGASGTAPTGGPGAAIPQVLDADIQQISELIATTSEVPLLIELTSPRAENSEEFHADLVAAIGETAGRVRLARVNVDDNPQAVQAFRLQALPTLVVVVQGKSVPVFEGVLPRDEIGQVMEQVVALAAREGVTGTVDAAAADSPAAPLLPPLHAKAQEALERGDVDTAEAAYREALQEKPADADAKAGLARVGLFRRTAGVSLQDARAAAAAAPQSIAAQFLAADMDLIGGHVEDSFLRLIDLIRILAPTERAAVRDRLLELFDVVGADDERVTKARRSLANALF
ncbi:tetratricopeptide repeat protein [Micrococcales bacterium 31B]|nr:tetratricopeptide repeat protein [Micrococcales bacterium 31B]